MKLLVTGGAGFIGSHFVRYYLNNRPDGQVVNLDALTYAGNLENLKEFEGDDRYTFVKGDVADKELVEKLVADVDAVVHLAAESHVDRSILDASAFIDSNIKGTQVLLDAALKAGKKRFHHVSTDEVFGALGPNDPPFNEETPYAPRNPYSASKAAADHLVRAYHITHGLPVTISNTSNNYGPYHFPEKLIPLCIAKLTAGEKVPVYGDGQQIRDWIYVEDHCRGILKALEEGEIGETYLFGGEGQIANLDIVKTLIELLGASEDQIEFVEDRPGHDRRYDIDWSKAERELDWRPEVSLEEGLKRTIEWYRQNPEWVEHCMSGTYKEYYANNYDNKKL